jgi:hypothetical protein
MRKRCALSRREMRVAFGHLHRRVSEQRTQDEERHSTGGFLEGRIDRWILKERYSDGWFVEYRRRRQSARPLTARDYLSERRAMTFMVPILAVVGLISFCLDLDAYAYATPSEIVVNPFFGFQERHHRYTDVQSINTRLIGKRHDQLECQISFKDGSTFSTDAPPSRLTNAEIDLLAAYVYERTTARWTHNPQPPAASARVSVP